MFKVFIYLYIFLESVLCKTWFWLFALRGEAGAEVLVVIQVAAGLSQDLEGSLSSDRDVQLSDGCTYSVFMGELHPQS